MSLNIFWFLPAAGGDGRYLGKSEVGRRSTNAYLRQIATTAEYLGYDGLLIPTGSGNLDPIITAASLATVTNKIKLLVALRHTATGGPTVFARQAATLDEALNGRLLLNVVPGAWPDDRAREGNFQSHDERYESADEFWEIWKRVLEGETVDFKGKFYEVNGARALYSTVQKPYPPLFFGGSSQAAHEFASKHVDTYLSWGEPPALVKEKFDDVREKAAKFGREVKFGLRLQVIVRETEEEAWEAANKLISHLDEETIKQAQERQKSSDSVGQARINALHNGDVNNLVISPNLWAGIGLVRSGAGTALVGSAEQIAQRIKEYVEIGAETFVFSGYPHLEESIRFAELVFPLLNKESIFENDQLVSGGGFEVGQAFVKAGIKREIN
ncbi:LLM class flavin-dependent oxidoreductase [Aliarcobacter butzleri]|uniref:LLM class flavin-dependent oxidoreductase n=1 Tax=Aliarcobacter butzleri TaxID=28197 RepID=UPI002B244A0D|nr:LLM class flavin-dependent oxidoreductase [Aliarcobacter butzleri]